MYTPQVGDIVKSRCRGYPEGDWDIVRIIEHHDENMYVVDIIKCNWRRISCIRQYSWRIDYAELYPPAKTAIWRIIHDVR